MDVRDVVQIPHAELAETCRRYHVRELAVFGSVLRDDFRDDSDIDVLVEYEPDVAISLYDHFDLGQELERLLGRKVDLVSKKGLNPIIRDEVLRDSETIYAA